MSAVSHPQVIWRGSSPTSDPVSIPGNNLCGFFVPAGFSGTSITFTVTDSVGGGTYYPMKDDTGSTITYTVAAGNYYRVRPTDFAGVRSFKMVSSATEAANTTVKLATRELA